VLSSTSGKVNAGKLTPVRGAPAGSAPAAWLVTRSIPGGKNGISGGVKLLSRVYFAVPESLGRYAAHASSTRAAAPRRAAMEAFAFQSVAAARAPACSAVMPPACTSSKSVGTGCGAPGSPVAVASVAVAAAAGGAGAAAGVGAAGRGAVACAYAVPAARADVPTSIAKHPNAATVRIALFRSLSKVRDASLVQAARSAARYDAAVEQQSADAVWARIEALASGRPGGVVATDGDGTLWSGDVGEDMFHAFLDHGRTEPLAYEAICRQARDHGESDAGGGVDVARRIYAAYLEGRYPEELMCELMAWCFAGWARAEVQAFARDVVDRGGLARRMHHEVLGVLDRARAAGLTVILVSASPIAAIEEAGARVGFDAGSIVAARPVFRGDAMLPDVERPIPYGPGKVTGLRDRIGAATPIYAAFGDNAFDVHLLASAAVPVAVRPKPRLRDRAGDVPGLVEIAQAR